MDYYLADRHFLPPGRFDRHFTEKLVYLPANWPVGSLRSALPVNPLPALTAKYLCFGSFNRLGKLNSATLDLWCSVLSAVPDARMLIGAVDGQEQALLEQFAARGIERGRLNLHPKCTMTEYLKLHHQVDICLDTYPYTGGTTTVHALSMAVPTLTLGGPTPGSRQSAGILGQLGLDDFVADDAEDFSAKGRYWAAHLDELAQLRAGIRERWQRSPAGRPDLAAAALGHGLREMWKRWCAGLGPASFDADPQDSVLDEQCPEARDIASRQPVPPDALK
jgi:predicted O-linked N-acetylglucosamine transferase (SPINDLY family)